MSDSDFKPAIEHLEQCEKAYAFIGTSGAYVLTRTILPLRDRVNAGERTKGLYDEIMEIAL